MSILGHPNYDDLIVSNNANYNDDSYDIDYYDDINGEDDDTHDGHDDNDGNTYFRLQWGY